MSGSSHALNRRGTAVFYLLVAMLLFSPLVLSGKPPLAVLTLELMALLGLAVMAWGGDSRLHHLERFEWLCLAALLLLPLLYLLPIPLSSRLLLPGQEDYYRAQVGLGASEVTSISLDAASTVKALLVIAMPVAVYWMTRALPAFAIRRLIGLMLVMAAVQASIGLIQYGVSGDPNSFWHLGRAPGNNAVGTWSSRNNFAGFLNLAMMVSLALFMATLGRHRQAAGDQSLRERLVYFSTWQGNRAFTYGVISLLFLLALVFSRSRMGIMTAILGLLIATMAYARRIGGDNVYGLSGTIVGAMLGVGTAIGLGPVLARFAQQDPLGDGRSYIFQGVFEGIGYFFPVGSGPGTFVEVFPRFQSWEMAFGTINRAHNSYLEYLFTAGLPAAVLIAVLLYLFARQWTRMSPVWSEFRFIQTGAGIGCTLTLLHDLVDYNLFVPANLVYFAFLAGVFFHSHRDSPSTKTRKKSRSRADAVRSKPALPEVNETHNPFMDPPA